MDSCKGSEGGLRRSSPACCLELLGQYNSLLFLYYGNADLRPDSKIEDVEV